MTDQQRTIFIELMMATESLQLQSQHYQNHSTAITYYDIILCAQLGYKLTDEDGAESDPSIAAAAAALNNTNCHQDDDNGQQNGQKPRHDQYKRILNYCSTFTALHLDA